MKEIRRHSWLAMVRKIWGMNYTINLSHKADKTLEHNGHGNCKDIYVPNRLVERG